MIKQTSKFRQIIYAIGGIGAILLLSPYFGVNIFSKKAVIENYSSSENPLREHLPARHSIEEPRREIKLAEPPIQPPLPVSEEILAETGPERTQSEPARSRGLSEIEDLLKN